MATLNYKHGLEKPSSSITMSTVRIQFLFHANHYTVACWKYLSCVVVSLEPQMLWFELKVLGTVCGRSSSEHFPRCRFLSVYLVILSFPFHQKQTLHFIFQCSFFCRLPFCWPLNLHPRNKPQKPEDRMICLGKSGKIRAIVSHWVKLLTFKPADCYFKDRIKTKGPNFLRETNNKLQQGHI